MAASDFRVGIGPAFSVTLIRFPTRSIAAFGTNVDLSGHLGFLSLRAAALYTVPAARGLVRFIPRRGRLRLQGRGSPREKLQLFRFASWKG
jgi:hypothetical protein